MSFDFFGNDIQKPRIYARRAAVNLFVFLAIVAIARTGGILSADHEILPYRIVYVFGNKAFGNYFRGFRIGIAKLSVFPEVFIKRLRSEMTRRVAPKPVVKIAV